MPTVSPLQDYIVNLFRDLIDKQEWSDSGIVSERVLRSYLLLFSCFRNYQPCVTKATQLFKEWKDSDGTMRSVKNKTLQSSPAVISSSTEPVTKLKAVCLQPPC